MSRRGPASNSDPNRSARGRRANAAGLDAEATAARLLETAGLEILAARYRTPHGEIDIVAREGNTLVFVEVKARKTLDDAAQAISQRQWARLEAAAIYAHSVYHTDTKLTQTGPWSALPEMRFDVVLVSHDGTAERIINARRFDEW